MNTLRKRVIHSTTPKSTNNGVVLCWLSRDIRAHDNWAMIHAQDIAKKYNTSVAVTICVPEKYMQYNTRHYRFYVSGLQQVCRDFEVLNIPTHISFGDPAENVTKIIEKYPVIHLVSDFCPLRDHSSWVGRIGSKVKELNIPFHEVDAHNIVPVWEASDKQEYAARTIRRKINCQLGTFLEDFPVLATQKQSTTEINNVPKSKVEKETFWDNLLTKCTTDVVKLDDVSWCKPGPDGAAEALKSFCSNARLGRYAKDRNNPNIPEAQSDLSPYFHFGNLSPQRAVLTVQKYVRSSNVKAEALESFMEEAIVRRELSDNFCYYNPNYDSLNAAHGWAAETLNVHSNDKREYIYTLDELESSKTHDDLWNAAQIQLMREGKLHGFLRMYWAKKVLEWTSAPKEALHILLLLNDKYSLDGNDPNGMVGCGWSVYGLHDIGFKERPIFGKIRYMNYAGCKRKFDVPKFVKRYSKYIPKGYAGSIEQQSTLEKFVTKKRKSSFKRSPQKKNKV